MSSQLSKCILVFGGTGYLGRHIVRASVSNEHPTYVYARPLDQNSNPSKVQIHKEFESIGVTIVQGELNEHEKLVSIIKQVDIVISAISTPQVMEQLKIIDAIKIAGNVQRFIPSDFGVEEDRISGLPPFQAILDNKKNIRKAVEAAKIPFTYISSTCLGTYFLRYLLNQQPHLDSEKELILYGSGKAKVVFTCEKDIGSYTVKVATDQRMENRYVMCLPPKNILSQLDVALLWEAKTGQSYKKVHISAEDLVKNSETLSHPENIRAPIIYSIFVNGDMNLEIRDDDLEMSRLYPDFNYKTVEDLLDGLLTTLPEFEHISL